MLATMLMRRGPALLALFFLGVFAACDCGDEGLTPWEPVVTSPDLTEPRVETPGVREREAWVDQFHQRDAAIDILWVVDITASMTDHMDRIGDNFDRFVDALTSLELDFRLGVTTTDIAPGAGGGVLIGEPPVLTPDDDVQSHFIEKVNLDFEVGAEQGLESARRVVSSGEHGFPREEAMLAIILLTDADDKSPGSEGFYVRYFLGVKGPGNHDLVRVSAIAGDVPDGCVSPGYEDVWGAGAAAANRINEVIEVTGGVLGSICAVDYGPDLDRIGLESAGLRRVFPLSHPAEMGSVSVEVNGVEVQNDPDDGWRFDIPSQSVRFDGDYLPPAGSVIHVRYRVQS